MTLDWLIVGAGFTGATLAERIASQLGRKVVVIDRRNHVAGNAYDCLDEHGILIHPYGPHIFHTRRQRVWDYLSTFTKWRPYSHRVLAQVDGRNIPVPFNLNSLDMLFPAAQAEHLATRLRRRYGDAASVPILDLLEATDADLRRLGQYVYDNLFLGYTRKQWGLRPEELSPEVTGRVPVRLSRDDRYFTDEYQAMPAEGYAGLFARMLNHPNIRVLPGVDYRDVAREFHSARVLYTGAIDEYFSYSHGPLPYRSIRTRCEHKATEWWQEVAVINYPQDHDYTRVTEFKHLTGQRRPDTTLMMEYPEGQVPGRNEPFYPIPRPAHRELYAGYAAEAEKEKPRVFFAGRLGDYRYYDMDEAVDRALHLFESEIAA